MRYMWYDNIKNWYTNNFSTDELATKINPEITFSLLWKYMRLGCDIYVLLGVGDSIVRERVMCELANRLDISYDSVYDIWLHGIELDNIDYVVMFKKDGTEHNGVDTDEAYSIKELRENVEKELTLAR